MSYDSNAISGYYNQTRQLPNQGGSYSVGNQSSLSNPNSTLQSILSMSTGLDSRGQQMYTPMPEQQQVPSEPQAPMFQGGAPAQEPSYAPQTPKKYINPATGERYTPEEYANSVFKSIPKSGNGDVGQYAGDAVSNSGESSESLMNNARQMNNSRNDIATGTTDPYDITEGGDVVYSPAERKAIQNAYAGIYDPALNDVFARLKTKEEETKAENDRAEKALDREYDREDKIFSTNEAIRKWRATTGVKGEGSTADVFSQTQLNKGASAAQMSIEEFKTLDEDLANYFVNPPTRTDEFGDSFTVESSMAEARLEIENGEATTEEIALEISEGTLPPSVKTYLISQLPATPKQKEGWLSKVWGSITNN